ncbi:Uu.00g001040.m01.CDS01 [Anthostomella pinea]|uniref:2-dehydropantoate 2-reductase n=1 Tax=Anthostomella pinea TaxID=933095 RepID=A0AAI8VJ97_9PEZI|nr:Uu.00g001040.m01.CDS01 [Anthostomella pinea]
MSPKILVFGTGSLGAVYTWVLSQAPAVDASDIIWGRDLRVRPRVARSVAEAVEQATGETFDYVVVTAKVFPTVPSTVELIRPAVSADGRTAIVLIQNGIGIEDEFARLYPKNPILSTVLYMSAAQTAPAVVTHHQLELLHVGTYPADAPAAHKEAAGAFVDLIKAAGATAKLHDDIQFQRWSKLLVNGSWNPICALSRLRDRQFQESNAEATRFVRDVMLEIADVAQAYGYAGIDDKLIDVQMQLTSSRDLPGVQPSMMADAMEGRTMEVDAIVGNAVRLAAEKGVSVPMLRTIYLLAGGLSASFSLAKSSVC